MKFCYSALVSLLFCGVLFGETPIPSVEKGPRPLIEYMGRPVAQTMHWSGADWLTRNKRELEESASTALKELRLKPGMVVCDLGAGNGYYALPIARAILPNGVVYATDIQQEMLNLLTFRAKEEGVTNVKCLLGELHDPKLPENTMDIVLLVDVYHEFSFPEQMLKGIRCSLKNDGLLVLLEYRKEDGTVPIREEHKMEKEQVLKEMGANGFRLERSFDGLPWQHMLFFQKLDVKK